MNLPLTPEFPAPPTVHHVSLQHLAQPLEWESIANQFADYNFRQGWNYGQQCAIRYRATSERVAIFADERLIGLTEVRIKKVPFLSTGLAYINGGPLTRRLSAGDGVDYLSLCLAALKDEYVKRRGMTLRILVPIQMPETGSVQEAFTSNGYQPTSRGRGYRTLMVNIARPLVDIRKGLAQKWRNCLNASEKFGLTICSGTDIGLFDEFSQLFTQFRHRKPFEVDLDAEFYRNVRLQADLGEGLCVTLAYHEGKIVAGHMASLLGDTCVYLLGATSEAGLKTKAAYLLQWHVISMAYSRQMAWYDLGGINPQTNPGVYHFKAGLNGIECQTPAPHEATPSGLGGCVTRGLEYIYRRLRHRAAVPLR